MALSEAQVRRYARHILLPDVGGRGQERLLGASVAVPVGPGRSAEVAALAYLAAAGVGRLCLTGEGAAPVTDDDVATGILFGTADVGRPHADAIRDRLAGLNPDVIVTTVPEPSARHAELAVEPTAGDAFATGKAYAVADALTEGCAAAVRSLAQLLGGET